MSKYKNKKVVVDGYNFDSKAEARYYQKLRDSGESFSSLSAEYWEMQKSIPVLPAYILPSGRKIQAIKYKADFVKYRDGEIVKVVDVKGYQVEIDEEGHPIVSWKLLQDGSVEIERNEQLNLLGTSKMRKEMRKVQRSTVDEFIAECPVIEHINVINPKDVLDRLKQGEDFSSIASDYGLSDSELVTQLDEVRQYYLPVADAWVKNGRKFEFIDEDKNNDNSNDGEN